MVARAGSRKDALRAQLEQVRAKTLWLFDHVPDEFLRRRVHSFYSPIGWHFGHVGRTEEYWVIRQALNRPVIDERLSFLYADLAENPKDNRVHIPDRAGTVDYLARTRQAVLDALDEANLDSDHPFFADGYAWEFALQHECQHQETIIEMLQLIQKQRTHEPVAPHAWCSNQATAMRELSGGEFWMGSNALHGYDNEKDCHQVKVSSFRLGQHPVTAFEWTQFIDERGYERPELWSQEGWCWRETENATMPEYWVRQDDGWAILAPMGRRAIHPDEPVSCISWFEADAYARWSGKRLPTEAEWEFAASHDSEIRRPKRFPWGFADPSGDHACFGLNHWGPLPVGSHPIGATQTGIYGMAGGVWEWTSSKFLPYPGFRAFPYDGYSKDHMLGEHFVCRGGSWATAAPILRCTFRNWYVPTYRQGLLGLRLAES